LTLKIPENWNIKTEEENNKLVNKTIELFANGSQLLEQNAIELIKDNEVLLNLTYQDCASNVFIGVEKKTGVFWLPITSKKYFIQLKSVLNHLSWNYHYLNDKEKNISLNNKVWKALSTQHEKGGNKVYQDFYARRKGVYYFIIISTYRTENQKLINDKLISSIELKK